MNMKSWKTIKAEYLLRDKWLTVRVDTCETPSGTIVEPYYVLEYPDWVHIIAFDHNNHILITSQYRHAVNKICAEIPCGIIETGETPIEAAHRELLEETGCAVAELKPIGCFHPNPATHTNSVHCFLALGTVITDVPNQDVSEDITFEFVPVSHILELIEDEEFSQGLHVASLMLGLRNAGLIKETNG